MHAFPKRKFDWRWEVLEVLLDAIEEVWPVLKKYYDHAQFTRGGDLQGLAVDHLHRALEDKEEDLPGCEQMVSCVACVTRAVGHNARWLRGCDCHADILLQNVSYKKKQELMADAGFEDGHCPLMGRRLVHRIHGGLGKMKKNVRDADSPKYKETLHRASDTVRTICLTLQDQVKNVWIDSIGDKWDFVLKPPHVIAGLF